MSGVKYRIDIAYSNDDINDICIERKEMISKEEVNEIFGFDKKLGLEILHRGKPDEGVIWYSYNSKTKERISMRVGYISMPHALIRFDSNLDFEVIDLREMYSRNININDEEIEKLKRVDAKNKNLEDVLNEFGIKNVKERLKDVNRMKEIVKNLLNSQ